MNEPYIHSTAYISGDVIIGPGSIIFPGAEINGEQGPVRIGRNVAVEDNCILNAVDPLQSGKRSGEGLVIGDNVIIGHGAVISGSNIGSFNLIGIKSVVNPFCRTTEYCTVAAGAVLESGSVLRSSSVVMGRPARLVSKSREIASKWIRLSEEDLNGSREKMVSYLNGQGKIKVSSKAQVHRKAVLVGNVEIGADSVIESGAVLRGDFGKIVVGKQVTISQNTVLHAGDPDKLNSGKGSILSIGNRVTVGNNVVLNGRQVGNDTIFEDNAFMLHHVQIGSNCVIRANTGVMPGMKVPNGSTVSGLPGKIIISNLYH